MPGISCYHVTSPLRLQWLLAPGAACPHRRIAAGPACSHMCGVCCRQVYHTARMQRVFAARFSGDGAYVFSGSDDMNVRVWKVWSAAAHADCLAARFRG